MFMMRPAYAATNRGEDAQESREAEEFDPVGVHRLAEGRLEARGGRERPVIHHHRRDTARAGALQGKRPRHIADDQDHLGRDRAAAAAVDDGLQV